MWGAIRRRQAIFMAKFEVVWVGGVVLMVEEIVDLVGGTV